MRGRKRGLAGGACVNNARWAVQSRRAFVDHYQHRHITSKMGQSNASDQRQLLIVFCIWKALLFCLTALCPSPGYDTSGLILLDSSPSRYANLKSSSWFNNFVLNLFRWDALYFVKAAERGLSFEQEWAFSPAFSQLLGIMGQCEQHSPSQ